MYRKINNEFDIPPIDSLIEFDMDISKILCQINKRIFYLQVENR